uniref:Uncharacterized protein n=1 Tax=Anguilla anguilla TaxID=7936 RepID=A0A0E9XNN8_ANGAN
MAGKQYGGHRWSQWQRYRARSDAYVEEVLCSSNLWCGCYGLLRVTLCYSATIWLTYVVFSA